MDKNFKKLLLILSIFATITMIFTYVNAATIPENTNANDKSTDTIAPNSYIIGGTRFTPGVIVTGGRAAKAGADDMRIYIAKNNGSADGYQYPKVYYFDILGDWYEYTIEGNTVVASNVPSVFDIYYVDNNPKTDIDMPAIPTQAPTPTSAPTPTPVEVKYTVTFVDGLNEYKVETVKEGEKVAKPADPKNSDSSLGFIGWKDATATSEGQNFDFENTAITKDTVLVAVWGKKITDSNVTLTGADDVVYTGEEIKPTVTVTVDSVVLTETTDYTVVYESNTNAGTANVKVTGTGKYTGEVTKTFTIKPAPIDTTFLSAAVGTEYTDKSEDEVKALVKTAAEELANGKNVTVGEITLTEDKSTTSTSSDKKTYEGVIEFTTDEGISLDKIDDAVKNAKSAIQKVSDLGLTFGDYVIVKNLDDSNKVVANSYKLKMIITETKSGAISDLRKVIEDLNAGANAANGMVNSGALFGAVTVTDKGGNTYGVSVVVKATEDALNMLKDAKSEARKAINLSGTGVTVGTLSVTLVDGTTDTFNMSVDVTTSRVSGAADLKTAVEEVIEAMQSIANTGFNAKNIDAKKVEQVKAQKTYNVSIAVSASDANHIAEPTTLEKQTTIKYTEKNYKIFVEVKQNALKLASEGVQSELKAILKYEAAKFDLKYETPKPDDHVIPGDFISSKVTGIRSSIDEFKDLMDVYVRAILAEKGIVLGEIDPERDIVVVE